MNQQVKTVIMAIKHFLLAVQFFTRIPIAGKLARWVGFDQSMLTRAMGYFPLIGLLIGVLTAAVLLLIEFAMPATGARPWLAAAGSTAFGLVLTGAFHEDGLTDLIDGLGGSADRSRALEIMKDSRIGTFGARALFFALFGKVILLTALLEVNPLLAAAALIGGHVLSRFMPVVAIRILPYIGDPANSKSGIVVAGRDVVQLALSFTSIAMLALVLWLPSLVWLAATVGSIFGFHLIYRLIKRRLGGFNGDALGAIQQCSELGCYVAMLAYLGVVPG